MWIQIKYTFLSFSISYIIFMLIIFVAGICWLSVDSSSGRCQEMLAIGQSQRECCGSGRATRGWTQNDEVDSGQLFYWRAFAGGAPECQACQGAYSCVCGSVC